MADSESRDKGLLRRVLFGVERAIAKEAAGGALRGAAQELREQVPDAIEAQVTGIVEDALQAVSRMAKSAAQAERGLDQTVHDLSRATARGALDELERQWRDGGLPMHDFMGRVNRLLDRASDYTATRRDVWKDPSSRAHDVAAHAMRGATGQLHAFLPTLGNDLRTLVPLGGEVAERVGRGLVEGLEQKLRANPALLNAVVHELGRALVGGLAAGVKAELGDRAKTAPDALAKATAQIAAQAAAASVRGAAGALADAVSSVQKQVASDPGSLRRSVSEVVGGVADAVLARVKVPAIALAGAGGLVAIAAVAMRRR